MARAAPRQAGKSENTDAQDSDNAVLPPFTEGESGRTLPSLAKKTSQPPKYYTEGTLLRAMETAGRTVDDEELRDAMKENGIGRPSTRAAIIETLFAADTYIASEKHTGHPSRNRPYSHNTGRVAEISQTEQAYGKTSCAESNAENIPPDISWPR